MLSDSKVTDSPMSDVRTLLAQMLWDLFFLHEATLVRLNSEILIENAHAVVKRVFAKSLLCPTKTLSAPATGSVSSCLDTLSLLSLISFASSFTNVNSSSCSTVAVHPMSCPTFLKAFHCPSKFEAT